ncbi:MAG TPA: hypothetical protein VNS80_07180, partial [Pseudolysinimonas sp.]|nr:hypothetical protein [Pseudolysinimonas sp.]
WMPDVCGAPVTDPEASATLAVEITLPATLATDAVETDAEETDERVPVAVTLRNDGPERIVGSSSSAPTLSFTRDATVVWHSYAIQDASARVVDLEPGESMTYETYFERVICGTEDDLVMDDPDGALPLAPAGDYEVRAVIVVTTDGGASLLATGPPQPFEIR